VICSDCAQKISLDFLKIFVCARFFEVHSFTKPPFLSEAASSRGAIRNVPISVYEERADDFLERYTSSPKRSTATGFLSCRAHNSWSLTLAPDRAAMLLGLLNRITR
jgi:hypothetical protein